MKSPPRLLTLDAFGTLFIPRHPIAHQYAAAACRHKLGDLNADDIDRSFRHAFKKESQRHPNYGKAVGLEATEWWANVIRSTYLPLTSAPIPPELIIDLQHHFSSSKGYKAYRDVHPFFRTLRKSKLARADLQAESLIVGIITNSDDRVPGILASFGLNVGTRRYNSKRTMDEKSELQEDINFVTLSYDVGSEKPHSSIFDAARALAAEKDVPADECLHVGDDLEKDYYGARDAGWSALLLDRDFTQIQTGVPRVANLDQLKIDHLGMNAYV